MSRHRGLHAIAASEKHKGTADADDASREPSQSQAKAILDNGIQDIQKGIRDSKKGMEEILRASEIFPEVVVDDQDYLREASQEIRDVSKRLDSQLAKVESEAVQHSKTSCCCLKGRCLKDEKGINGQRAIEAPGGFCCKIMNQCKNKWMKVKEGKEHVCRNWVLDEINEAIANVPPAQDTEKQVQEKEIVAEWCREELNKTVSRIKKEANKFCFHGNCVIEFHSTQLGEEISHELLVKRRAFHDHSIGAKLFEINQRLKLLWSGVRELFRKKIKAKTDAGELSRGDDCAFARVVESANQLRNCSVGTLWEAASGSFANVDSDKPLLIALGKDNMNALQKSTFWETELKAVANNPPTGSIVIIIVKASESVGLDCGEVMKKTRFYIEKLVMHTRSAKAKWEARRNLTFACGEVVAQSADQITARHLPSDRLLFHNLRTELRDRPDFVPTAPKLSPEIHRKVASTDAITTTTTIAIATATGIAAIDEPNEYAQYAPPFTHPQELRELFRVTLEEFLEAGSSPQELKSAGFNDSDMKTFLGQPFDFDNPPELGKHPDWKSYWTWAKHGYLDKFSPLNPVASKGTTISQSTLDEDLTCESYPCPIGSKNQNLASTVYSRSNCCKFPEQTCATFQCPSGWVIRNDHSTRLTQSNCCERTCATFSCPIGLYRTNLNSTTVSEQKCCEPDAESASSYTIINEGDSTIEVRVYNQGDYLQAMCKTHCFVEPGQSCTNLADSYDTDFNLHIFQNKRCVSSGYGFTRKRGEIDFWDGSELKSRYRE